VRGELARFIPYILVLQWPGDSEADFGALISMEEQVGAALGRYASVDGHDFGSGEMNISIETDRPAEAFADAANALREGPRWGDLRAAYREARGGPYEILWPRSLRKFSVKRGIAPEGGTINPNSVGFPQKGASPNFGNGNPISDTVAGLKSGDISAAIACPARRSR